MASGQLTHGQEGEGTVLLRSRDGHGTRVTPVELFFDLVYVFAVTQLSHLLLEHLTLHGALQTLMLLLAVWWAWVYTAWFTNWFDPNQPKVRLILIGIMLASLIMSATLPGAFGERGLVFAGAYVAMQIGRTLFIILALGRGHPLRPTFERILTWMVASGVLWLLGGLADGSVREALWLAALAVDYLGPAAGFATPGLGRSGTEDWSTIDGAHMAERCQLFVIVAFGESILVTGATFGGLPYSAATLAAFVLAFAGAVTLWWIYFDRTADAAAEIIAHSSDPGRLGRSAYTYFHLPMVAGIIVSAVADELTIAHPYDPGSVPIAAVALGGPALYLFGHALFKRAVAGYVPRSRPVALAALLALVPLAMTAPFLVTSAAVTLLVVVLAAWDTYAQRRHARSSSAPAVAEG